MVSDERHDHGSSQEPDHTSKPSTQGGSPAGDVTQILFAIEGGNSLASEQLLPLVYEELRRLAAQKLSQEKPGQTLQATALVHEAYVRLVDNDLAQHWNSRGHFFAAAAEAMRRILVDNARRKQSVKAGGDLHRVKLSDAAQPECIAAVDLITELHVHLVEMTIDGGEPEPMGDTKGFSEAAVATRKNDHAI